MPLQMRYGSAGFVLALIAGSGCHDAPAGLANSTEVTPPEVVELILDSPSKDGFLFAGTTIRLEAYGIDARGVPASVSNVLVSLSDTSMATVVGLRTEMRGDVPGPKPVLKATGYLKLRRAGDLRLTITSGSAVASRTLRIQAPLPTTDALIVDSFYMAELTECGPQCRHRLYAPVINLRAPTGTEGATVVGVRLNFGSQSLGVCNLSAWYWSGRTDHLFYFDAYPYFNDMIFAFPFGGLPNDATVHIIVRKGDGGLGVVSARASKIIPRSLNPFVPIASMESASGMLCADWDQLFP